MILGMGDQMRFGVEIEASEGKAWPRLSRRSKQIQRSSLESPGQKQGHIPGGVLRDLSGVRSFPEGCKCSATLDLLKEDLDTEERSLNNVARNRAKSQQQLVLTGERLICARKNRPKSYVKIDEKPVNPYIYGFQTVDNHLLRDFALKEYDMSGFKPRLWKKRRKRKRVKREILERCSFSRH